jgi:hypothetical protein
VGYSISNVAADRRVVRVTSEFFADLDAQLPTERGPQGQPSTTDFLVLDLPAVVDRFATEFASLPEAVTGLGRVRVLITAGRLVQAFAVYGLLTDTGDIELIGIDIDR